MEQAADIAVSGLGWVTVSCLSTLEQPPLHAEIDVYAPRGVEVFVRRPMPIGGLPID